MRNRNASLLVIIVLVFYVILFLFPLVSATWWGYDWQRRAEINISNVGSAQTNYAVKVNVSYDSDMQSDFSDLRFANKSESPLDYWIENITDSVNAIVWVEVDSLPENANTTVYMYYSNSGASSNSSGPDTFLFFDNFDDGTINSSLWTEADNGNNEITETGGKLQFARATNDGWTKSVYSVSSFTRANLSFEFEYKWVSNNAAYDALMMGWKDDSAGVSYTNFVYSYYNNGCSGSCTSVAQTIYEDGSSRSIPAGNIWVVNQSYNVRVMMKEEGGAFYDYSVDNGDSFTTVYDSSYSTESLLHVGWPFFSGSHQMDNARVRKWMLTEPTSNFGAEEQADPYAPRVTSNYSKRH